MLCLQVLQYTEPHVLDGKTVSFFVGIVWRESKLHINLGKWRSAWKNAYCTVIARFSFQIILYLPVKQK